MGPKAIHKCQLCSKQFCFDDMATEHLCWQCEETVTRFKRSHSGWLWVAISASVLCWLVFFLVLAKTAYAQPWQVEYFVTGINVDTNERVVGWLDGKQGDSLVQGTVLDHGDRYVVVGEITGKGQFELRSMCCFYRVEVADEVLENKLQNARKAK